MLSRVIHGARVSLYVGVISVSIALVSGSILGLLAGYYGGRVDMVIMRLMDILFGLPAIVLAIAITSVLGPSLNSVLIAIGIVYAPQFARVARAPTLSLRERDFVTAARAVGAGDLWIVSRHILPNMTAPIVVQATVAFSTAILTEATLSYLGLGTQPPTPSWGTMLNAGKQVLLLAPSTLDFPWPGDRRDRPRLQPAWRWTARRLRPPHALDATGDDVLSADVASPTIGCRDAQTPTASRR